jgi:ABC-type thiamine transport system ATPase subunit
VKLRGEKDVEQQGALAEAAYQRCLDRYPAELSGEDVTTGCAGAALARNAPLMLLDEPLNQGLNCARGCATN